MCDDYCTTVTFFFKTAQFWEKCDIWKECENFQKNVWKILKKYDDSEKSYYIEKMWQSWKKCEIILKKFDNVGKRVTIICFLKKALTNLMKNVRLFFKVNNSLKKVWNLEKRSATILKKNCDNFEKKFYNFCREKWHFLKMCDNFWKKCNNCWKKFNF